MPVCFIDVELWDCSLGFTVFALNAYGCHIVVATQRTVCPSRMGCNEMDVIVRSIAEFQVPDALMYHPMFKLFSWFLLIKLRT